MINIKQLPLDMLKYGDKFGYRILNGQKQHHNGIDFKAKTIGIAGDKVYAVADGVGARCYKSSSYGNTVILVHIGFCSLSAHMREFIVKDGQTVKAGDVIGYMGNTGASQGVHLHFELRLGAYNDDFWVKDHIDSSLYLKCIDPYPFLSTLERLLTEPEWKTILRNKLDEPNGWIRFVESQTDGIGKYLPDLIMKLNNK